MNKKGALITIGVVFTIIAIMFGIYVFELKPTDTSDYEDIKFVVSRNEGKNKILDNLVDANLIKNKYAAIIYMYLNGRTNLQAGEYEVSRSMGTKEIINMISSGEIITQKRPSTRITFVEGITLKEYLKILSDKTDLEYDKIIKEINNEEFLKKLIADYDFLTEDILNDKLYYALEGYLFHETYDFYIDTDLNTAIRTMLNKTKSVLNKYQDDIKNSGYSVHEILTMASIIEKEANSYNDRTMVSQVIRTRLQKNMSLGMDVTSYYGVQKSLKEVITAKDLNDENPYNTRVTTFLGLPVGAICNPGESSIKAALNPSDTDYIYFFADIKTGKVYFTNSYNEFQNFKKLYG